METVTLGSSGLEVSPICFGTWQLGGDWGQFDEYEAVAAIHFAREQGINFFDTAHGYGFGDSESLLGRALRDDLDHRRDQVVIATKGGLRMDEQAGLVRDSSPEWIREGTLRSLAALEVDFIDLLQLHWPDPNTPLEQTGAAVQELVDEGLVRHVGVSNFSPGQMDELSRTRPVETLQPPYSMFRREIEADVLPYCQEHHMGVLVYGPLAHGLLTGTMSPDQSFDADDWRGSSSEFRGDDLRRNLEIVERLQGFAAERSVSVSQLAVAWTLAHPAVQVSIVGTRSQKHIEESLGALEIALSPADLDAIDDMLAGSVQQVGPSPEGMP
jgi:hypothetical protein